MKLGHYQRDCYDLKNKGDANDNSYNVASVVKKALMFLKCVIDDSC